MELGVEDPIDNVLLYLNVAHKMKSGKVEVWESEVWEGKRS